MHYRTYRESKKVQIMNFFEYQEHLYSGKTAMDDANNNPSVQEARQNQPDAPHGQEASAKAIAEFSKKDHILSAEELIQHRKHCRAKPGNCPFEKAVDEADDITPNQIKVTKQDVFNRLATILTQMFQTAKNLAKPAMAESKAVEEAAAPKADSSKSAGDKNPKATQDEAPADEPNTDAKLVAEIIEGGIEKMVEIAKSKGCNVDMDDKNTKYIVKGPSKETSSEE